VKNQTKVFILGAGCSAERGYPLGTGLATDLEKFLRDVPDKCPVIKQSVTDTLNLLRGLPRMETLDQLARRIDNELRDWQTAQGVFIADMKELSRRSALANKQILAAKIATHAIFLLKEAEARETGLPKYRQFITNVFGGPPWKNALAETDCHVLTFNYDRLFEIAFLNSFDEFNPERIFLYGEDALNSGYLLHGDCHLARPKPGRFSFLKLHGSAGWWVAPKLGGGRHYCPSVPVKAMSLEQIEKSIPKECGGPFGWEPLLAFPHERQGSQEYFNARGESSGYAWAPYIDAIWQHANSVVSAATEVRVIGYSFNPIDSRYMVNELLSKATCERIVIQNKVDVRPNLESYKQLRGRLDFDSTPFGTTS
jgi:hypothetical protein